MTLSVETLGDYTISHPLGSGPFGETFLAHHRFIKRPFILKVLPETPLLDPGFFRRFEAEVAEIASLDHPHIAKIHTVSCSEGRYFLVSDPIFDSFGETMHLGRYLSLKGKTLGEEEWEELLRQIASALDYAHSKGVVHGGIKLTNLLIAPAEKGVKIYLSDFGLSRLLGEGWGIAQLAQSLSASLTLSPKTDLLLEKRGELSSALFQTLSFLAPEQKGAKREEGTLAAADIYSFGVLTYYLLLRKLPEGAFPLPSQVFPELKRNWDLLLYHTLQLDPKARPEKLLAALDIDLAVQKSLSKERLSLSQLEGSVESVLQMAFEFPSPAIAKVASGETADLKPLLKPPEIARPEYEPDPAAIFHRDTNVSPYTPKKVEAKEIEPLLTDMVVVPGGDYYRGSVEGARDEMPRHKVHLTSFAIDIHPVTNEQFVRFLEAMGGEKDQNNNDIIRLRDSRIKRSAGKLIIESGYAKHPVVGVTWYGASAYAKWVGKRLPYEAEWEAAATAGRESSLYPTGNEIERSQANFFSSDTTPVMSYPPNPIGLYDLAGNVYEWCADWYAYNYYDASAMEPEHPKGPLQGVYRVLRGGCWKSLKDDLRSSHRHRNNPGAVNGTYGFRCAADVAAAAVEGESQ